MPIRQIYAHIACRDLAASTNWYQTLFGRAPDAMPMQHLAEWHQGGAGLQLFQNPDAAGKSTLTLIVSDLDGERRRLSTLAPGDIERADTVNIVRFKDLNGGGTGGAALTRRMA